MIRAPLLLLLLGVVCAATAAEPPPLDEVQRARYQALTEELRCVVCQNRNIAESDVPLAADMRGIIHRQIAAGRSDAQIKAYLVERYGDFVLYRPPFRPSTWVLWLGPLGLLMIALGVVLWLWRRGRESDNPPPPDAREIERLLEDDAP